MSVQVLKQTTVTRAPCAPTLMVLMFAAVSEDFLVMGEPAQVIMSRSSMTVTEAGEL